ncbi:dimethylarginine dimethylaminohydrolase [Arenicella sp. 4NH20-0111]|uniref:dimethylarginine dimethylaminohydrolase family protein n=1 Tax=Arenicella sp. 4NH20-0111 TaxID=3127648 RepID=UPI0031026332
MFKNAIVRKPARSMVNGLTSASLGAPNYELACQQHADYVQALKECGLNVLVLPSEESYPDSCFVEDAALMTPDCAILTRPGATTRQGEVALIEAAVKSHYDAVYTIQSPDTIEAGDIMMVGNHYYIGLSDRTNADGADQMIRILEENGMQGSVVEMSEMLHLKTGLSFLENNNLLVCGEFVSKVEFDKFNRLEIPMDDAYSANSVWINGTVLVPAGFDSTVEKIQALGYQVRVVEMSEFQKLDGGLSCLSLRF